MNHHGSVPFKAFVVGSITLVSLAHAGSFTLKVLENSFDHSRIMLASTDPLPAGTPVRFKVLRKSDVSCSLGVGVMISKVQEDAVNRFDCGFSAKEGQELVATTKKPGILNIRAGNYGEQIVDFKPDGTGFIVTYGVGKSGFSFRVY